MKTKHKWTLKVPEKEGWYWIKYKNKHDEVIVCPCYLTRLKRLCEWVVHTARNDFFTDETRMLYGFDKAMFYTNPIKAPK